MQREMQRALEVMTQYVNGTMTRVEMVSRLAELDAKTIGLLPHKLEYINAPERRGLREDVEELKTAIAEGKAVTIKTSDYEGLKNPNHNGY